VSTIGLPHEHETPPRPTAIFFGCEIKVRIRIRMFRIDLGEKNSMAGLSSSSSSSSPPPLTDEEEYDSIRPKSSRLRYDRLGYISEEVMNELATDWKLRGESKGLLQSIWSRHPINPINKQGNKIILNQIK
jgi:hypothetical protein